MPSVGIKDSFALKDLGSGARLPRFMSQLCVKGPRFTGVTPSRHTGTLSLRGALPLLVTILIYFAIRVFFCGFIFAQRIM